MTLRIAYAGIIQLVAQFATLLTGLIFVTIVTRNLSVNEFGLWQTLGSSVGLLLIPLAPINYWALRYSARNHDVGKTSLLSGMITIPIFVLIYVGIALTASASIESILVYVLIYSVQIPMLCIWEVARPIARSYKPEYLGYATIGLELGKVLAAYYTISILRMGLTGAILSLALGQLIQIIIIVYIIRPKIRGRFQFPVIKKWYKSAWIPISNVSISRLSIADSIVVSLILGSTAVVGIFQASKIFTLIIRYSETFVRILYPKLIRDKINSDITLTIKLQSFFLVPLLVGAITLSESLLGVLGPQYSATGIILRILTIVAIMEGIEFFVWNILTGIEQIDENIDNLEFRKLRNSWLVRLPLIDISKSVIYFIILGTIMYNFRDLGSQLTLAIYWSVILLLITLPVMVYKIILLKRTITFEFPTATIMKYVGSGIVMAVFLYSYQQVFFKTETTVIASIKYLIIPGITSVLIYLIVVYLTDPFIKKAILEVKSTIFKKNKL